MRVVIDTNVLVSAIINPHGAPGRVLDATLARSIIALYDDRILDEYREVLRRPAFGFQMRDVDALLDFIEFTGEQVSIRDIGVDLPDSSDLPFLEVAAAGDADALITGNIRHFRPNRGRDRIYVCTPAEFVKRPQSS